MTYRAPVRRSGLWAALRSVARREYRQVDAVTDLSFELAAGEVVGFLGPNGAGKSTTMKMLSGILHPTAGEVRVLGFTPWRRQSEYLQQMALVRGSQPMGGPAELTVMDAFRYRQVLYDVPDADFRANLAELGELLDLEPLLNRQVRALSLGERMRTGLASALLYRPRVLFLDEPSIGLDVSAAATLRRFVAGYAASTGATVLLTSHYMAEVESLCRRVILIDGGRLQYDGPLATLAGRLSPYKRVRVTLADGAGVAWEEFGEVEAIDDTSATGPVTLRVPRDDVPSVTSRLLAGLAVADLAVEDPPLETVMDRFYRDGAR
ncbi:ATP-binding cassette domain-containing protein [Nonomuraea maheshkhaliensis]